MDKMNIQGVITHALAFKEFDRIITVFTPYDGLIKLVVKGALSHNQGQGSTTTPLTLIEALCTRGKSELYSCRELTALNSHLGLRQNLKTLEAAFDMLKVVAATQMPGKPVPDLYQLFLTFLAKLPSAKNPLALSASFRLKTLRHEGLLDLCEVHEQQILQELAFSRDLASVAALPVDAALTKHIKDLFDLKIE